MSKNITLLGVVAMMFLLLFILFVLDMAFAQTEFVELVGKINSQSNDKIVAYNEIADYIDELEDDKIKENIVESLVDCISDDNKNKVVDAMSACEILHRLNKPWSTKNIEERQKMLYQLFIDSKVGKKRELLDKALMNSTGMYWDVMYRIIHGDISPSTDDQIKRIITDFNESYFTHRMFFYYGIDPMRVCAIKRGRDADLPIKKFVDESITRLKSFKQYYRRDKLKSFTGMNRIADANYYQALNYVLAGDTKKALNILEDISNFSDDEYIYVFTFYWHQVISNNKLPLKELKKTVVDKNVSTKDITQYTIFYLKNNTDKFMGYQSEEALVNFNKALTEFAKSSSTN